MICQENTPTHPSQNACARDVTEGNTKTLGGYYHYTFGNYAHGINKSELVPAFEFHFMNATHKNTYNQ